jgi:pyrroloquinoline quinone biosynthesis protein E|tara:strand:- start:1458 stop:2375 length:918 start_codon:yes stop_codon:yes gene_type:complete
MDIEPTTGCNFRCTMCQVSEENFIAKNLDFEIFKKVVDENKQLLKIKLQGIGEPFVNKNFFKMVDFASSKGICSEMTTNGSLLTEKNINYLIKSKLSRVTVSIDGATPATFEKIRINSNFQKVVDNCYKLVKSFKVHLIRPEISAWCVLQKSNLDEMELVYELCKKIGFDKLTYQLYLTDWGKSEWREKNKKNKIDNENIKINQRLENIHKKSLRSEMKVEIFKENLLSFSKQCAWPWSSAYISKTGDVVPCCIIGDEKVESFGNVNKQKFEDIWNSKVYQDFRRSIKNNTVPEYCKNCYEEIRK